MTDRIQVPSILEGVTALKDGGLSIRFHTNELTQDEKVTVMGFLNKFGWMLFAEQEHDDSTELEQVRKDTGGKTPSQRLRSVIYVEYQQSGQTDLTFEQYYARRMEQLIGHIKQNLN